MNDESVLRAVLGQIDWWWNTIFRPRTEDLTDEEYLWEPVPGCWTLHPTGDGGVRQDFHWPPPQPTPFTTIAWRMHHIGVGCLVMRTLSLFPDSAPEAWPAERFATVTPFPDNAAGAIAFLDRWWRAWRGGLDGAGGMGLWTPIGDLEGGFDEMQLGVSDPTIGLVLHIHRELMHHGAEINLLRDLYRAQQPRDAFVSAVLAADRSAIDALRVDEPGVIERYRHERPDLVLRAVETGDHDAVRLSVALGFDSSFMVPPTPLHHAAASGDLPMVELLLSLGADSSLRDPEYDATPEGWAVFFSQTATADHLHEHGAVL